MGAQEAGLKFSRWVFARGRRGSAAEAWALPRYLPSVIPKDFEEIVKIIFFEWITKRSPRDSTRRSGGSGRIEDACGESPAASYFGLLSLGAVQIIRSLFVHYSFLFVISLSLIHI